MEVFAVEQQLCPCYKERQEFQKLVELKDYGLVVYCHRTCIDNIRQGEPVESAVNTSRDVFILHNKKDVKITTSQLTSELEKKNISCPRCRKRFEHAQELMKGVKSIDKKNVMSICDHCRKRALVSKKPFCACEKIVKLFKTVKGEQTEDTKHYANVLPSKTGHLRKYKQKEIRTYPDLQIYQDINSPAAGHEPEVEQMFYSDIHFQSDDTELSETDSKEVCIKQAVAFNEPIKPMKTSFVHTPHQVKKIHTQIPDMSLIDSDTTFVETYVGLKELPRSSFKNRKQEESFEDTPSIDAKEELKRRHDISLRQMVNLENDSRVPFFILKGPNVYETPKIAPWVQKESTTEDQVNPEMGIKKIATKTKHDRKTRNIDYVSNRLIKYGSSRNIQRNLQDFEASNLDEYHQDKMKKGLYDSEERAQNVKNLAARYFSTDLKLGCSVDKVKTREQHVAKSKSVPIASVGNVLKPQFSFFFPKDEEKKEKHINLDVSSSQLIKDTQEKFRLESEKLKRRKEEERLQKLQQEEKNKLAREEKKRQAEEKKRLADEEKKKIAELQQILSQRDKSRDFILGKEGEFDVKKDTKSKPKQRGRDDFEEKPIMKVGDQSNADKKDEGVEKEKKLKTKEEEKFETEEEKLKTEKDKTAKILRDKNQQEEIKDHFNVEESLSKEKVASPKAEKSIKKKRDIFNNIKTSTSNMNESINKENKEISEKKKKTKILTDEGLSKIRKEREDFKKLQAEYIKEKALKKKHKLELEAQKAKEEAERKAIEKIKRNKKLINQEGSKNILKQVTIKKENKIRPSDIDPELLKSHKRYHNKSGQKSSVCPICLDSELELEVLSLDYKRNLKKDKIMDIIIGEKIYKNKPRTEKIKKPEGVPIFFQKDIRLESDQQLEQKVQMIEQATKPVQKKILSSTSKKDAEQVVVESGNGIIRYALSDRTFIDKGWTQLPTEKVVRKMNVYRMRPAHPEFDWFKHNKNKRLMTYDTGERLAEFDDNGRGRWYYRNGRLALDYYDAEETNAQQRFVIYSSGEPDERGRTHPITMLATFDYLGNGIVLDHAGKIRLKYNQTEGVVLDRAIGPVSHWKWHTLNDPPVLQRVMIDTQITHKDPDILKMHESPGVKTTRQDNEEMLAIEFNNFIKEKRKKLSQTFKPFQIKMKALKINEHFSLKVLDQASVYLIFRDGLTNLRVNMGMILDDKEIVDTDTSEVGEVSNSLERFPARTDSLAGLQRSVIHAQRYEKQHAERERWLLRPEPCASADLMTAVTSPPMRSPLRTVPTGSSSPADYPCKKSSKNLYYDTRLPY